MARRKTKQELERQAFAKAVRSRINLKYSIAAMEEINDVLWDLMEKWDTALAQGEPFEFDLADLSTKRLK